mgnify:CR=1 FL=1
MEALQGILDTIMGLFGEIDIEAIIAGLTSLLPL